LNDTNSQKFGFVVGALTVMPTESLPRAKAGVGINVFADGVSQRR
jgi:hypothetical protein